MQVFHQRQLQWAVLGLVVLFAALARVRLEGDAPEYLGIVWALAEHASLSISSDLWPRISEAMRFHSEQASQFGALPGVLDARQGHPYFGFGLAADGQVYAIHFWLYSVLAAPFVLIATALGLHAAVGFAFFNITAFALTLKFLPRLGIIPALLFFALGAVFYLRWSGPEILTAGAVLAATVAIIRRDWALAILLAGIGAAQNPSVLVLMPAALCYVAMVRLFPALALLPAAAPRRPVAISSMVLAGIATGFAQFAFFKALFGHASMTGRYFTDPALVTWGRLVSFFADLNQGMLVAVPGLLAGLLLAAWRLEPRYRKAFAFGLLLCVGCVLGMAIPTFAAINWNSGGIAINRYAFWAAMPLLALLLVALELAPAWRRGMAAAVLAVQALALVLAGFGHRPVHYLTHTWLADRILKIAPAAYNPVPEIMFERSRGNEQVLAEQDHLLLRADGQLVKVLRHVNGTQADLLACGAGQRLASPNTVQAEGRWEYLNAPVTCQQVQTLSN